MNLRRVVLNFFCFCGVSAAFMLVNFYLNFIPEDSRRQLSFHETNKQGSDTFANEHIISIEKDEKIFAEGAWPANEDETIEKTSLLEDTKLNQEQPQDHQDSPQDNSVEVSPKPSSDHPSFSYVPSKEALSSHQDPLEDSSRDDETVSSQQQFALFLQIKKACLSVLSVFGMEGSVSYQLNYLQIALKFIEKRFYMMDVKTGKKDSLEMLLVEIQKGLDCCKESRRDSKVRCVTVEHSRLPAERFFVEKLGLFYRELKSSYLDISRQHQQQCEKKLLEEKQKIIEELKDAQRGQSCRSSSVVRHYCLNNQFWQG